MSKENIKVSIVLPLYNVGTFFGECMESVLRQSHRHLEIILVDDGSTDNSGELADAYARLDSRVKVIHQQNKGVSAARNRGICEATGEYVCFSDPDDVLCDDYVSYMLALCEETHTDIAVCAEVFTPFMVVQPQDCIRVVSGEDAACEILYGRITVGCYSKMFKRRLLKERDILFFEDVHIGEGFNFNVLAFCSSERVAISQHKVYHYRLDNSGSAMTKFTVEKCEMGIQAISIIRDNLLIRSPKLLRAIDFAEYTTIGSMFDWMVMADAAKAHPTYYKQWKEQVRSLSWKAIFAPTSKKLKIATLIRMVSPWLWAYLRKEARKRRVGKRAELDNEHNSKPTRNEHGGGKKPLYRMPRLRATVRPSCYLDAA